MPARTVKIRHDEETRSKIQAAKLINQLQNFALAQATITVLPNGSTRITFVDQNGDRVWPMTKEQIASAKILLDKSLPNLQSVEVKTDETKTFVLRAPPPESKVEDWLAKYGPKTIEHAPQPKRKTNGKT